MSTSDADALADALAELEELKQTAHFKEWHTSLVAAGHELLRAEVAWVMRVGNGFPLFFALKVAVRVAGENRVKDNEVAIFRPSTVSVCAYCMARDYDLDRFVLVREYRSPVNNGAGFVYELPGGSSFKPAASIRQLAADELREETGLSVDPMNFVMVGHAQPAPTVTTHREYLMSIALNEHEMDEIAARAGSVHGNAAETERTCVVVATRHEIFSDDDKFGWNLRGMVETAIPSH